MSIVAGPGPGARSALPLFGALSFAYFAAIGLFNPFSPLWLQQMGLSTLAIGSIASFQAWTRIVVPYAWSWLGDHSGQRVRLLRVAAAGSLVCAVLLLWAEGYGALALLITALFAFNGAVTPLSEAAVVRHLAADGGFDAGRYGRVRMWGSIGFIVAVLLGGLALERLGVSAFPVGVILLYALLLGVSWRLPSGREAVAHDTPAPPALPVLRRPDVAWFFASVALTVLAHTALYTFFSLYLEALGYSKTEVGLFWALSVVLEVAFFWFQGRWFHRWSSWRWLQLAAGTTVLRFIGLAAAGSSVVVLVLSQLSHALTFAAHHAACTQLLHRYFSGRLHGRGMALYSTLGYGLPGVLGGVGGGWIVDRLGYEAIFWVAAAAALAGLVCVNLASRRDRAAHGEGEDLGP